MQTTNAPAVAQRNGLLAGITPNMQALGTWLGSMGNTVLATALAAVNAQESAREAQARATGQPFTALTVPEKEAVVLGQALTFVNATDYMSHLTRYQLVKRVRDAGLSTQHPEHFDTVEAFAEAHGMGSSEYYDLISLFEWIFPWLQQNMKDVNDQPLDPGEIWMKIGKSKLRQLVPFFRVAIDVPGLSGEQWRERDNQTLARLEENIAADELGIHLPTVMANPRDYAAAQVRMRERVNSWPAETRQTHMVSYLLRAGVENQRFEDLRRRLRPTADTHQTVTLLRKGNNQYMVLPIAPNQVAQIQQKFRDYQIEDIDLDGENAADIIERVPILTSIRAILDAG